MPLSNNQKKEIQKMIDDSVKRNSTNWRIVQSIPESVTPNTIYFLQVSISPRRFEIYHTDKDGDFAGLSDQYLVEGNYDVNENENE